GQSCRHKGGGHGGARRYRQEVDALFSVKVAEEGTGLTSDIGQRGDLALAQLLERNFRIVIGPRDPDLQKIEQPGCGDLSARGAQIDINLLIGEICDAVDLLAREKMELFIVELGDVSDPIIDTGNQVLLPRIIEHIRLKNGDINAAQQLEISEVL